MGLVEERKTRYRVDTLLARLMDNIPVLARPADTPAPSQSHEAGAQVPAEAAPTPAPGQGTTGNTGEPRSSEKPEWRRVFGS
jgi:hypothetical protein